MSKSLLSILLFSVSVPCTKLKPLASRNLKIPEPSDICYAKNTNTYFIVSDNGILFETDSVGNVLRKAPYTAFDYEAVFVQNNKVYVSEEMTRNIIVYDATTLEKIGNYKVPNHGGRNKGFESLTYNQAKECFILVSEKDPSILYELDAQFKVTNSVEIKQVGDISSATFYNNKLYLLSDEDRLILELDPLTYKRIRTFSIPVLNPEGICFGPNGELKIVSDDLQKLYEFPNLPNN